MCVRTARPLALVGSLLLLGTFFEIGFMVNMSASLPRGLYRRVDAPAMRGAIVIVCLPAGIAALGRSRAYLHRGSCPDESEAVGKRVVAITGDRVAAGPDGVYVNGRHLPGSERLSRDSAGRPMASVDRPDLPLQPAELWLMGDDPRSWDSRYFGPVQVDAVVAVVEPVWTWE